MIPDKYRRQLQPGERLFREGESGEDAFFVESGVLEIHRDNGGERNVMARVAEGDLIGEMALVDDRPRTASVTALTDVRLRVMSRENFRDKLDSADPFLRLLLGEILRRYRSVIGGSEGGAMKAPSSDRRKVIERIEMEHEIASALQRGEFQLFYQPIVSLEDRRTAGFEALIRWQHAERGWISPGEFIPVAEDSELIVEIGRWSLLRACEVLSRLKRQDTGGISTRAPPFVTVNISARHLCMPKLFDEVRCALETTGAQPAQLKLEVTESLLMKNWEVAAEVLSRCRALGVKVAVDDFGTGYSSLSYLHRFPVDTLKIDRSFVTLMVQDPGSKKILRALGTLAKSLYMDIVAEGVEMPEQAAQLYGLGFEHAQGFLFSKAVPEAEAMELLHRLW